MVAPVYEGFIAISGDARAHHSWNPVITYPFLETRLHCVGRATHVGMPTTYTYSGLSSVLLQFNIV